MNYNQVIASINNIYHVLGTKKPVIFFCDSPSECLLQRVLLEEITIINLIQSHWNLLCDQIEYKLSMQFSPSECKDFETISTDAFKKRFIHQFKDQFRLQFRTLLRNKSLNIDKKWFCDRFWDDTSSSIFEKINDNLENPLQWYGSDFRGEKETWSEIWNLIKIDYDSGWKHLEGSFWDEFWRKLSDRFRADQIEYVLWYHLRALLSCLIARKLRFLFDDIWDDFWGSSGLRLRSYFYKHLRGELLERIYNQLEISFLDFSQKPLFIGGWDAYDQFISEFFKKCHYTDPYYKKALDAYQDFSEESGLMFAYQGFAFVSRKPDVIKFDNEERLHCEDGYAVQYRDGWGLCSWHGLAVPQEWIIEKSLDAQTAISCENMEQRRVACEILGWHKILNALNARTINKHSNPLVGELLEVELPDLGLQRFLKVMCGTAREFALPVPPHIERAAQAQAWLNFTTEDAFIPKVRT